MKQSVSLIVKNAFAVTMDRERRMLSDAVIVVDGNTILALGGPELLERYASDRVVDAKGMAAFPGLVNTHTHLFQTLLRGLGRDKTLFNWLDSSVRRAMRRIGPKYCYYAALTGCLEAMRAGTATLLDFMYCHGMEGTDEGVFSALEECGVRGVFGRAKTKTEAFPPDFACPHTDTEQSFLEDAQRFAKRCEGHSRLSAAIAPGIIWDVSDDGFREVRRLADRLHLLITMHTLETPDDNAYCQDAFGENLLPHLERLGILGPDFLGVHCVDLAEEDFALLKAYDVKVSHNPASNMILASGVAPVQRMLEEGLCVSLGVDGAASNDSQNMLETLKLSSLLQKAFLRDPLAVPAAKALEMATLMGARALGQEERIGSLEVGKKADILLFDCNKINTAPTHDPVCALVYNAAPANVDTLIIDGEVVLYHGEFSRLDEERIIARTQELSRELARSTGLASAQWGQTIAW